MNEQIARLRVRTVRLKNGATVHVMPTADEVYARDARRLTQEAIEMQGSHIAGFAFVIWGSDGSATTISLVSERSRIPPLLVPEFVKLELLDERIQRWTIEEIEDRKNK